LEARIAREISVLARDAGKKPAKRYEWEEWVRWLELLGEREHGEGRQVEAEREVEWTWLADSGPLFSGVTETEWVLGKLCRRLETVLEEGVEGERGSAGVLGP
jgi:potassium channel subfamily K